MLEKLELHASIATDVTTTRHELLVALARWGCSNGDNVALVFSELVTNAVLYGSGASSIVIDHEAGRVRLVVHDGSGAPPVMRAAGDATGGFGLRIVDQLVTGWGWDLTPDGKQVWAELPCCSAEPLDGTVCRR